MFLFVRRKNPLTFYCFKILFACIRPSTFDIPFPNSISVSQAVSTPALATYQTSPTSIPEQAEPSQLKAPPEFITPIAKPKEDQPIVLHTPSGMEIQLPVGIGPVWMM